MTLSTFYYFMHVVTATDANDIRAGIEALTLLPHERVRLIPRFGVGEKEMQYQSLARVATLLTSREIVAATLSVANSLRCVVNCEDGAREDTCTDTTGDEVRCYKLIRSDCGC